MNAGQITLVITACWLLQACVTSAAPERGSSQDAAIANLNLGAGYVRQGRADLAIEPLERALELNPRLADAHSTIAIAYDQLGRTDEAEPHYRRATQLDPNNPAAANSYAVFLCQRQKRWRDAEAYFRRAADNRQYPTPAVALTNAGLCARDAGDNEKAEEYFREALERDPRFPGALSSMLELAYRSENHLQARAFLQRYLDVQPPTAALLRLCFDIERQLDNASGAERCAAQMRERFPDSPELAEVQEIMRRNGR